MIKLNILFTGIFLMIIQPSIGQDLEEEVDGEIEDAQIVIEKDRVISLPRAAKIIQKIEAVEVLEAPTIRNYKAKDVDYSSSVKMPEVKASEPKTIESDNTFNHYLKAGFGNYSSPLLLARFNLSIDPKNSLGINLNHLSFGSGEKDGKNSASSESSVGIYGGHIGKQSRFSTQINYNRSINYFYGYSNSLEVDRDSIKHTYSFLDAFLSLEDIKKDDEFNYKIKAGILSATDNFNAAETTFEIGGIATIGNQIFLESKMAFSKYKDAVDLSRNYFLFKGYYRFDQIESLTLDAGLLFNTQSDDPTPISSSKVFPYINANYQLSENYQIGAKLDAGYQFNTYYGLAQQNRFLGQEVPIQNSEVKFRSELLLNGTPRKDLMVGVNVSLASVQNLQQLNNTFLSDSATFTALYNSENTTIFSIKANSTYSINADHSIQFEGVSTNYSSSAQSDVFHLPNFEVSLSGQHRVMDPVLLKWSFKYLGGLKAFNPSHATAVELEAIPQLNLGFDYQFAAKAGAFLMLSNLLNNKYERYLNYPVRGLQIKAGLSYRF